MTNWQDYQVGRRVVCVRDNWKPNNPQNASPDFVLPHQGVVYTIRETLPCDCDCGSFYLRLQEIRNPPCDETEIAFNEHGFRPVDETKLNQFREILETPPGAVKPAKRVPA